MRAPMVPAPSTATLRISRTKTSRIGDIADRNCGDKQASLAGLAERPEEPRVRTKRLVAIIAKGRRTVNTLADAAPIASPSIVFVSTLKIETLTARARLPCVQWFQPEKEHKSKATAPALTKNGCLPEFGIDKPVRPIYCCEQEHTLNDYLGHRRFLPMLRPILGA